MSTISRRCTSLTQQKLRLPPSALEKTPARQGRLVFERPSQVNARRQKGPMTCLDDNRCAKLSVVARSNELRPPLVSRDAQQAAQDCTHTPRQALGSVGSCVGALTAPTKCWQPPLNPTVKLSSFFTTDNQPAGVPETPRTTSAKDLDPPCSPSIAAHAD